MANGGGHRKEGRGEGQGEGAGEAAPARRVMDSQARGNQEASRGGSNAPEAASRAIVAGGPTVEEEEVGGGGKAAEKRGASGGRAVAMPRVVPRVVRSAVPYSIFLSGNVLGRDGKGRDGM